MEKNYITAKYGLKASNNKGDIQGSGGGGGGEETDTKTNKHPFQGCLIKTKVGFELLSERSSKRETHKSHRKSILQWGHQKQSYKLNCLRDF